MLELKRVRLIAGDDEARVIDTARDWLNVPVAELCANATRVWCRAETRHRENEARFVNLEPKLAPTRSAPAVVRDADEDRRSGARERPHVDGVYARAARAVAIDRPPGHRERLRQRGPGSRCLGDMPAPSWTVTSQVRVAVRLASAARTEGVGSARSPTAGGCPGHRATVERRAGAGRRPVDAPDDLEVVRQRLGTVTLNVCGYFGRRPS